MVRAQAAIVGSGNIETDLLSKLLSSDVIEPRYMVGIDPDSPGLAPATTIDRQRRVWTGCLTGVPSPTSSSNPLRLDAYGVRLCRAINLSDHIDAATVNMITCGGQATIPIVQAVSRVTTMHLYGDCYHSRFEVGRPGYAGKYRRVHAHHRTRRDSYPRWGSAVC